MLLRLGPCERQNVALCEIGQHDVLFLFVAVASRVNGSEACKAELRASRAKFEALACANRDAHRIVDRRRHLARDKALPNERVEAELVAA